MNEVADEAALLALYRKEVAQLKAALLEGRGGMIITADGEVVSAEEMLARMKHQHEDRQRSMEEQLKRYARVHVCLCIRLAGPVNIRPMDMCVSLFTHCVAALKRAGRFRLFIR